MTISTEGAVTKLSLCCTCGQSIDQPATGRKRLYCSHRCRQAAYEQRKRHRPDLRNCGHLLTWMQAHGYSAQQVGAARGIVAQHGIGAAIAALSMVDR